MPVPDPIVGMESEGGIAISGGGEIIGKSAARVTRKGGQQRKRNMVGHDGQVVVQGFGLGPVSGDEKTAVFQRSLAFQLQQAVDDISQTTGAEAGHAVAVDVIAAKMAEIGGGSNVQVCRSARELRRPLQIPSPATILAQRARMRSFGYRGALTAIASLLIVYASFASSRVIRPSQ